MTIKTERRNFLQALAAGALVLGFDPLRRTWVTEAQAAPAGLAHLPHLDGTLSLDPASLAAAADDFGHYVHRTPVAVLTPGSVNDIVKMVRYSNQYGLKIAARGQGHTTAGQAQVSGGIVIDMSALATVHSVGPAGGDVDAGVVWHALVNAAFAVGLTPPVLTDYIELSIGGTLTVGGIGGMSSRFGLQIDNVESVDVVTGCGDLVHASRSENAPLFHAVLGGLGQFGIIVRAQIRLVPAPQQVRVYELYYNDIDALTADQEKLIADGRFNYVEGSISANATFDGWSYNLEAAYYYTPPQAPDDAKLLAGLHFNEGTNTQSDEDYLSFADRLAGLVDYLQAVGLWTTPHPWFDVFVPGASVNSYVKNVLAQLSPADPSILTMLVYPVPRALSTQPFFRVPEGNTFFLFDILRFPSDPTTVPATLTQNRELFEDARALGGTRYPISSIPFTHVDWVEQYGPAWIPFLAAKALFDPKDVLTPGPGIFASP